MSQIIQKYNIEILRHKHGTLIGRDLRVEHERTVVMSFPFLEESLVPLPLCIPESGTTGDEACWGNPFCRNPAEKVCFRCKDCDNKFHRRCIGDEILLNVLNGTCGCTRVGSMINRYIITFGSSTLSTNIVCRGV